LGPWDLETLGPLTFGPSDPSVSLPESVGAGEADDGGGEEAEYNGAGEEVGAGEMGEAAL